MHCWSEMTSNNNIIIYKCCCWRCCWSEMTSNNNTLKCCVCSHLSTIVEQVVTEHKMSPLTQLLPHGLITYGSSNT